MQEHLSERGPRYRMQSDKWLHEELQKRREASASVQTLLGKYYTEAACEAIADEIRFREYRKASE